MFLLTRKRPFKIKFQSLYVFFVAFALIIISILLSVPVRDGFIYDLRFIPFLLGGIYGGKRVTIALGILLILIRIPFGGSGTLITAIMVTVSSGFIIWLSSRFFKKPLHWRLAATTISSLVYSFIGFLIPSILYGFTNVFHYGVYTLVLSFSTFFVSYLLEILLTSYILKLEAIKYEKMEIVSHLAASISHEVRNPLTSVKGFLQLILEHQQTHEDGKAYAAFALDEVVRASSIIDDYLTFAKPHPEKQDVLEIEKEVKKCKEIIGPLALKNHVEINTVFFHSGRIKGDPNKFRQVLLNVCKNAIEAMPSGGTLSILISATNNKTVIHIADTGIGMSPEHVARLGEPYFSLKGQKGTGLGMMVVFRIVENMGGTVSVSSKRNIGTSVSLSFPEISYSE
jgi:two-component system sporulation sensor kinase B